MPDEDNPEVHINIVPVKKRGEGELFTDPYAVLPGALKQVNEQSDNVKLRKAKDERFYTTYAELLVKYSGDSLKAVAELYNITEDDAAENLHALRQEIHQRGVGTGLSALLEQMDVALPNQIAILKDALYGKNLAGRLKSVEMLRDIEGKAGQKREGVRMEDVVRIALASQDQDIPEEADQPA